MGAEIVSEPPCRNSRAAGQGGHLRARLCDSLAWLPALVAAAYLSQDLVPTFVPKWASTLFYLQLSATDVSARTTMKGAAKCDKHCELQNSVNQ